MAKTTARKKKPAGKKPSRGAKKATARSVAKAKARRPKTKKKAAAKASKKPAKKKKVVKKAPTKKVAKKAPAKKASKKAPTKKKAIKKAPAKPKTVKKVAKKKVQSAKAKAAARAARAAKNRKLNRFRKILLERYDALLVSYNSTKGSTRNVGSDGTEDYIDYAVSSYDRDFFLSLTEMERGQIRLVEEALKRIDRGEFGTCMQCDQEIPEKRLEVESWARHCVRCQELEEQGLLEQRTVERDDDDEDSSAPSAAADDESESGEDDSDSEIKKPKIPVDEDSDETEDELTV